MIIIVKLSGGLITDKNRPFSFKQTVVDTILEDIKVLHATYDFVIVLGGGSFGHPIAKKYRIQEGLKDASQILGFCLTQKAMQDLSEKFVESALKKRVPLFPIQLSDSITLRNGHIRQKRSLRDTVKMIHKLIGIHVVPVLYGVPCLDEKQGFSILSGDEIFSRVAMDLKPHLAISGSITEVKKEGKTVDLITPKTDISYISGSNSPDVTGGMRRKVIELVELAKYGVPSLIVNLESNRLKDVIYGNTSGTKIREI